MASDINQVILMGRITRDVGSDERSFGFLPTGSAKAEIGLAVNRAKKVGDKWEEEANFFNVILFGKRAEALKPYLLKGTQIVVVGHLKQDRWEKDGKKNSRITIIADDLKLVGGRRNSSLSPTPPQNRSSGASSSAANDAPPPDIPQEPDDEFADSDERAAMSEDIPF